MGEGSDQGVGVLQYLHQVDRRSQPGQGRKKVVSAPSKSSVKGKFASLPGSAANLGS